MTAHPLLRALFHCRCATLRVCPSRCARVVSFISFFIHTSLVPVRGSIWLDDGAVRAVRNRHKSLFPVGVVKVVGEFSAQDAVSLRDASGNEFARGLSNFDSKVS